MSRLQTTTVVLAGFFLAMAGSARSQTIDNTGKFFWDSPYVYGSIGGVVFRRSNPSARIIVANNPGTTTSYLNGTDLKFGRDVGFDGTIGIRFLGREALEARVLNFGSVSATNSFVTPGAFIGAGFTGPGGTTFSSQYQTGLSSWEINWRHQLFDQLSLIAGVRSIKVHDDLAIQINSTVASGDYNYNNMLRGGQIGAELALLPVSFPFQVNVVGKIGKYQLHSGGGIIESANGVGIGFFGTNISDQVYGSEIGVSAGYRMSKNLLLRAGYERLTLTSLGLASNNASNSLLNPSLLNANVYRGNLTFQGVNFAAVVSW